MRKEEIYQVLIIIVTVAIFVFENRKVAVEDRIFLWGIFLVVIVLITTLFIFYYIKDKLDKVEKNETEILKLKDQINFRNTLENINYRLGKLEKRGK